MDNNLKQSLEFDLSQLQSKLAEVESKINEEKYLNDKTEDAAKVTGMTGGGLSTVLVKQAFKASPLGRAAAIAHTIAGIKTGEEIADAGIKAYSSKLVLLENERTNLIAKIERVKTRLQSINNETSN